MKNINKILHIIFILSTTSIVSADCSNKIQLASASTWDNLRNSKESLKYQTSSIIEEATKGKSSTNFTISSIPNKFLSDYSDKAYCAKKLEETSGSKRLRFKSPNLGSAEEVSKWISEFSQGSSEDGKKLYKACDKTCSPAYEYNVSFNKNVFTIKALVSCGHARDKNDNQYKLTAKCNS